MSERAGALPLTGERTCPGIWHERYWFARHDVTYRFVAERVRALGRRGELWLLDAGAGEGYGADHIRAAAGARVVAVDYDAATSAHARHAYPMLDLLRANLVALPFRTSSVDAVVSLQTVEHLWDQPAFVAECARVLRPGGLLAVSTPNRITFPGGNPFHVRELDAAELLRLLAAGVGDVRLLGVHHGPRIRAFEARGYDLVGAQLRCPYAEWDDELAAFVADVRPADFVVSADMPEYRVRESLDLVAFGSAP